MRTQIAVVTHKEYPMPADRLYMPVMAGSALIGESLPDQSGMLRPEKGAAFMDRCVRDDSGDNISAGNRNYCELTALYWIWKNLLPDLDETDCLGMCHYRRYFASPSYRRIAGSLNNPLKKRRPEDCFAHILTSDEADRLMDENDIILPSVRRYYIETSYSHYAHAHHAEDLDATREIIKEKYPHYLSTFDRRMSMRSGHRFNMFIMKKGLVNDYCEWLFRILFELEKRLDLTGYTEKDQRVYGYVAERLLDVWIDANGYSYRELPYIMTESEHKAAKAAGLVARKFRAGAAGARQKNKDRR